MPFKNIIRGFIGLTVIFSLQACVTLTDGPNVRALRSNADSGDRQSQYQLGLRYTNGQGLAQDYATAADWFNRSARLNYAPAQYMLGIAYTSGRGVYVNNAAALNLFTAAARQGHARAQYQLGNAVANGRGTERDYAWAARWYGKAARQGHAQAMFSLGVSWASGLGLPADPVRALAWLDLAAARGAKQAGPVRAKLVTSMSAGDIKKAATLAARWKVSKNAPFADVPTILYVQRSLRRLKHFSGKVDGRTGPMTQSSVKKYSIAAGLSSNTGGQIDKNLIDSLRAALKKAKKR